MYKYILREKLDTKCVCSQTLPRVSLCGSHVEVVVCFPACVGYSGEIGGNDRKGAKTMVKCV